MLAAAPGEERATVDAALRALERPDDAEPRYVLTPKAAQRRIQKQLAADPKATYTVTAADLHALLSLLAGKDGADREQHLARVRATFPALVD